MNKGIIRDIAKILFAYLEEKGEEKTSTAQLLREYGFDIQHFTLEDLFTLHGEIFHIAEEEGMEIETEDSLLGMPWVCPYVLKARKCPCCGSTDIACILYGDPVWSPELEREIREKKTVLGGCLIEDVRFHCNSCKKDF